MRVLTNLLILAGIFILGAFAGSNVTLDGVARDCQKQTFFHVSDMRFECMEWKKDFVYWDPTYVQHLDPYKVPPR